MADGEALPSYTEALRPGSQRVRVLQPIVNPYPNCPYKLTFSDGKWRKVTVFGPDMQELYRIQTESKVLSNSPTEIVRCSNGDIVARLEFHTFESDAITYRGSSYRLSEFIPKTGLLSGTRTIITPNGPWSWRRTDDVPALFNSSGDIIAQYNTHRHFFRKSEPPTLDYTPELYATDLDLIVVGWLVMMRDIEISKRRRSHQQQRFQQQSASGVGPMGPGNNFSGVAGSGGYV